MGKLYSGAGAVATPPRRRRIRVEVAPDKRAGDWKVTADSQVVVVTEGKRKTELRFPTQGAAIKAAARWAIKQAEAGELLTLKIKRPNGKIRDERTYPRSSDPKPASTNARRNRG